MMARVWISVSEDLIVDEFDSTLSVGDVLVGVTVSADRAPKHGDPRPGYAA